MAFYHKTKRLCNIPKNCIFLTTTFRAHLSNIKGNDLLSKKFEELTSSEIRFKIDKEKWPKKDKTEITEYLATIDESHKEINNQLRLLQKIVYRGSWDSRNWFNFIMTGIIAGCALGTFIYYRSKQSVMSKVFGKEEFYTEFTPQRKLKDNSAKKTKNVNKFTFDDVCGNNEAKEELKDIVDFLNNVEKYESLNVKLPKGILMHGPPGCGKTLLAKALANEANVSFISCQSSDFDEVFVGIGPQRVRQLFKRAREIAPCIIFIDEIELFSRSDYRLEGYETTNEMLVQMDGFDPIEQIIVIGSTNRPKMLDKALLRSGRFDRKISVNLPEKKVREQIIQLNLKNTKFKPDVNVSELAKDSLMFSGADLANMVNSAKIAAAKSGRTVLEREDFTESVLSVSEGIQRSSLHLGDKLKQHLSVIEASSAIVALLTSGGSHDIRRISIIPRGDQLSSNQMVAKKESQLYSKSRKDILALIDTHVAGQVGEELIFGRNGVSNSSMNKLGKATELAKAYCAQLGMGKELGFSVAEGLSTGNFLPDEVKNAVDENAIAVMKDSELRVGKLLKRNMNRLRAISKELMKSEDIRGNHLAAIMEKVGEDMIEEPENKSE